MKCIGAGLGRRSGRCGVLGDMKLVALALLLTLLPGCSSEPSTAGSAAPPTTPTSAVSPSLAVPPTSAAPSVDRAAAERVADRFRQAANSGDRAAVSAVFAENARFDSVGRIYPSRDDILTRFLIPEVLDAGGRYEVTTSRWDNDRYVVEYSFTTRSGARERFTYAYLIRDNLIHDVLGRYA
jgi:hypothetical protein